MDKKSGAQTGLGHPNEQEARDWLVEILERQKALGIQAPLTERAWGKSGQWIEQAGAALVAGPWGQAFIQESREAGSAPEESLGAMLSWVGSGEKRPKDDWSRAHAKALRWACRRRDLPLSRMLAAASGSWGAKSAALEACAREGWAQGLAGLAPLLAERVDSALYEGSQAGQAEGVAVLGPLASAKAVERSLKRAAGLGHAPCCARLAPLATREDCEESLIWAARKGHGHAIAELVPYATPLSKPCEALATAARQGSAHCVELLIPISDPLGQDSLALSSAADGGHVEALELLMGVSDPLAGNSRALLEAARRGHSECVRRLLARSDVNATDSKGRTALHAAASWCPKDEVLRLLLGAGALPLADCDGRTPLDLARHHGGKNYERRLMQALALQEASELSRAAPAAVAQKKQRSSL
jgi:hypothetical protein